MQISVFYDYLTRSRRDLWTVLEAAPDELLARPLMPAQTFKCIKDHVFHIALVEDNWLNYTILRDQRVLEEFAALVKLEDSRDCAGVALGALLEYWRAVERRTLSYLARLNDAEQNRVAQDSPTDFFAVDGLLWHVMTHEMRHAAQLALLLRMVGVKPPALDLLWYLPQAQPPAVTDQP